jgi:hypothetical protein
MSVLIKSFKIIICLVLPALVLLGCSSRRVEKNQTVEAKCALKSKLLNIDWKNLNEDHNGSMFCVVFVEFGGHVVKLLGFEPSIEQVQCDYNFGHPILACSLIVGSESGSSIHFVSTDGRLYLLPIEEPTRPIQLATMLYPGELLETFDRLPGLFTEVDAKKVYVYRRFFDDVKKKDIQLPQNYVALPSPHKVRDVKHALMEKRKEAYKKLPSWAKEFHEEQSRLDE